MSREPHSGLRLWSSKLALYVLKSGYGPEGAEMPVRNFELNP